MLQALETVERVLGLHRDRLDRGVVLLEPPRCADERPRRAEAGDEVGDAAFGLFQDLDRGAFVVSPRVGGVRVLVWIEIPIRVERNDLADLDDRAVRSV